MREEKGIEGEWGEASARVSPPGGVMGVRGAGWANGPVGWAGWPSWPEGFPPVVIRFIFLFLFFLFCFKFLTHIIFT